LLGGKKVHPRRQNPGYAYVYLSCVHIIIVTLSLFFKCNYV